tara:strand:- start:21321 stop:21581 length:261 start_codon:yes stop_codon:yes gene_type:complete
MITEPDKIIICVYIIMSEIDLGFTKYIDDEDTDLLEWYCYNYDVDDLDEMVCWLNKLGYKQDQVTEIFNIEDLFVDFYQNYLKSIE